MNNKISSKKKCLAIIPARGDSKRIPKKNIKLFLGKPIIQYSIELAFNTNLFDEIMVSTDDIQIAGVSESLGANVPFMRSKENSNDYAVTSGVVFEVLQEYQNRNVLFDYCCCIYPTAPLIRVKNIAIGFSLLKEKNYDSFFPVVRYNHPIQRAYQIVNDKLIMNKKENLTKRTQDLTPNFHDAGQFYWIKVSRFLENKKILTNNTGTIELSELETQDIDNKDDWKIAEMKYKLNETDFNKFICLKKNYYSFGGYSIIPIRESDMELIRWWRNEQIEILRQKTPITAHEQKRYFKEFIKPSFNEKKPDQILFSYLLNKELIGYGGLTNIDWESKSAEISFILDSKRTMAKNLYRKEFSSFFKLIKQVAFDHLFFHRLYTETFDVRLFQISLLEEDGFILEGRLRDHILINGKHHDSLIHGLIN